MKQEAIYNNIVQSVVKWIMDFRSEFCPEYGYVNFDAHAQVSELPAGSLIGPAGCGIAEEEDGVHVVFSIGVCTDNDPNLFELTRLMSALYGRLRPQSTMDIYDHESTVKESWMVLRTPIAVTPVTKAELRSTQFINCEALIDPAALASRPGA